MKTKDYKAKAEEYVNEYLKRWENIPPYDGDEEPKKTVDKDFLIMMIAGAIEQHVEEKDEEINKHKVANVELFSLFTKAETKLESQSTLLEEKEKQIDEVALTAIQLATNLKYGSEESRKYLAKSKGKINSYNKHKEEKE